VTIVVDTSALVCLLLDEPDAPRVEAELEADPNPVISAGTLVETLIVAEGRKGPAGALTMDEIIREATITTVDHDERAARAAIDGWRRFGKGRHPAALNLGDCYAYGLARSLHAPILCVGDDFEQTDVDVV
jgi:ribonuclease VapC